MNYASIVSGLLPKFGKIQNFGQSTSHYYMALFVGTESDTIMKTVGFLA